VKTVRKIPDLMKLSLCIIIYFALTASRKSKYQYSCIQYLLYHSTRAFFEKHFYVSRETKINYEVIFEENLLDNEESTQHKFDLIIQPKNYQKKYLLHLLMTKRIFSTICPNTNSSQPLNFQLKTYLEMS
jgi:hypothetical protein